MLFIIFGQRFLPYSFNLVAKNPKKLILWRSANLSTYVKF